jgi:hypothetical protein
VRFAKELDERMALHITSRRGNMADLCCGECGRPYVAKKHGVKLKGQCVDIDRRRRVYLSGLEARVMRRLWQQFGAVVHFDSLYGLWDGEPDFRCGARVIYRLRQKLCGTGVEIENEPNLGYRLTREVKA